MLINEIRANRSVGQPKNSLIIKRIERDQVQKQSFDFVDYEDETALMMMMMRERYSGISFSTNISMLHYFTFPEAKGKYYFSL